MESRWATETESRCPLKQLSFSNAFPSQVTGFLSNLTLPRDLSISISYYSEVSHFGLYALEDAVALEIDFSMRDSTCDHTNIVGPSGALHVEADCWMNSPVSPDLRVTSCKATLEHLSRPPCAQHRTELWISRPNIVPLSFQNLEIQRPDWVPFFAACTALETLVLAGCVLELAVADALGAQESLSEDNAMEVETSLVILCTRLRTRNVWISGGPSSIPALCDKLYQCARNHASYGFSLREVLFLFNAWQLLSGGDGADMLFSGVPEHVDVVEIVDRLPSSDIAHPSIPGNAVKRSGSVWWPQWKCGDWRTPNSQSTGDIFD